MANTQNGKKQAPIYKVIFVKKQIENFTNPINLSITSAIKRTKKFGMQWFEYELKRIKRKPKH